MKRRIRAIVQDVYQLGDLDLAKAAWDEGLDRCWHDYKRNRRECTKCGQPRGSQDIQVAFHNRREILSHLHRAWPLVDRWREDPLPLLKALEVVRNERRQTRLMFGLTARDLCIAGIAASRYREEVPLDDE